LKKIFTAANDSLEQRQKSNFLFALCFLAYTFSYFGRFAYAAELAARGEAIRAGN
jgi:hypothetical protein